MTAGIILIDKPREISSAKVVSLVKRRIPGLRRIGHAGTLDPSATGLLVCLLDGATRLAGYAESGTKEYEGEIEFGLTTDSDDLAGTIVSRSSALPAFAEVEAHIARYIGEISQRPPSISAVKVNGERAYRLARAGTAVTLASRPVSVFAFEVSPIEESAGRVRRVSFRVRCSKGTYIRSLARDLGSDLRCGGVLARLRRRVSEPFSVDQAHPLEEVCADHILDWRSLFPNALTVYLDTSDAQRVRQGDVRTLQQIGLRVVQEDKRSGTSSSRAVCINHATNEAVSLFVRENSFWQHAMNV